MVIGTYILITTLNVNGLNVPTKRHMLTAIKGEINSNTIIVGDFNTPLSPMDRSS